MIRAVLLDIEGTTAPVRFVSEVLFPFAAARLHDFVAAHAQDPEVRQALAETAVLEQRDLSDAEAVDVLLGWIKADRKATPLKTLQGKIWREGYESGALVSPVYPDAVAAMRLWKDKGLTLAVYSSGSLEAQQLLYRYSDHGDLTGLFSGFFDTRTGPKLEAASYAAIAAALRFQPREILFLSDLPGEITAARAAGLAATRIDRDRDPHARFDDGGGHYGAGGFAPVAQALAAA